MSIKDRYRGLRKKLNKRQLRKGKWAKYEGKLPQSGAVYGLLQKKIERGEKLSKHSVKAAIDAEKIKNLRDKLSSMGVRENLRRPMTEEQMRLLVSEEEGRARKEEEQQKNLRSRGRGLGLSHSSTDISGIIMMVAVVVGVMFALWILSFLF